MNVKFFFNFITDFLFNVTVIYRCHSMKNSKSLYAYTCSFFRAGDAQNLRSWRLKRKSSLLLILFSIPESGTCKFILFLWSVGNRFDVDPSNGVVKVNMHFLQPLLKYYKNAAVYLRKIATCV